MGFKVYLKCSSACMLSIKCLTQTKKLTEFNVKLVKKENSMRTFVIRLIKDGREKLTEK